MYETCHVVTRLKETTCIALKILHWQNGNIFGSSNDENLTAAQKNQKEFVLSGGRKARVMRMVNARVAKFKLLHDGLLQ